jgi:hypothetical protein
MRDRISQTGWVYFIGPSRLEEPYSFHGSLVSGDREILTFSMTFVQNLGEGEATGFETGY